MCQGLTEYNFDINKILVCDNIRIYIATQSTVIKPLAILAHEISHYILLKIALTYKDIKHNEDGVNVMASYLIDEFVISFQKGN